jgi:Ca-activated chloride channel family protein
VTAEKKKAAADFLKFLQQPKQQQVFQKFAFRDFEGKPGAEITEDKGMLTSEPKLTISPPTPSVLDLVQKSWNENRKKARVIMVVDVSGSMGEPVGDATKLELAQRAASKALDQFSKDDELSLWVFSSKLAPDGTTPYIELVPRKTLKDGLPEFRSRIESLTARGGTGLYASTRAAVAAAREQYAPERINAVIVLTDGRNDHEDNDLDGLVKSLEAEDVAEAIRVFPIAYGDDADLTVLRRIADASRGAAYDAKDPASIDKVFTAVVSNF